MKAQAFGGLEQNPPIVPVSWGLSTHCHTGTHWYQFYRSNILLTCCHFVWYSSAAFIASRTFVFVPLGFFEDCQLLWLSVMPTKYVKSVMQNFQIYCALWKWLYKTSFDMRHTCLLYTEQVDGNRGQTFAFVIITGVRWRINSFLVFVNYTCIRTTCTQGCFSLTTFQNLVPGVFSLTPLSLL